MVPRSDIKLVANKNKISRVRLFVFVRLESETSRRGLKVVSRGTTKKSVFFKKRNMKVVAYRWYKGVQSNAAKKRLGGESSSSSSSSRCPTKCRKLKMAKNHY